MAWTPNLTKRRSPDWNYGGKNWKLSRSKIELFTQCERCFYLDNVLGVTRPKTFPLTLNIAVDKLLKKEFDIHRVKATAHPLLMEYGIDAIPFKHKDIDIWRENFDGIKFLDEETGLLVSGAIDDVWINKNDELIVVDYKATSKDGKIVTLDDSDLHNQYKRQIEVYQWLLSKLGFAVSKTGYFVYVNGLTDKNAFDGKLEFDVTLVPLEAGDTSWIEPTLIKIKSCLESKILPPSGKLCEYCAYIQKYRDVLTEKAEVKKTSVKKKNESTEATNEKLF